MRGSARFVLGDCDVTAFSYGRVLVALPALSTPFECGMSAMALYPS